MYLENNFYNDSIYDKWSSLFVDDFKFDFLIDEDIQDFMKDYPTLASDGFLPFEDNIYEAYKYGVKYIIQPVALLQMI